MKKLLTALFSIGFACGAFAQAPGKPTTAKTYQNQDILTQNGVAMKSGKVVMMKNGQSGIPLTKEIKMANGTIVTPEGVATKSDGSTTVLREGDYVMMSGSTNKKLSWKTPTISPVTIKTDTLKK